MSVVVFASPGQALVIHVPSDYETITEAVLIASDYDTVLVASGFYPEPNLAINDRISLFSETGEADCATIYGAGGLYIHIESAVIRMKGFTIYGYTEANIYLDGANAYLENLIITGAGLADAGMGIRAYSDAGIWSNLTIVGNRPRSGSDTGGVFAYIDDHLPDFRPSLNNCIIAFNEGYGINFTTDNWYWGAFFTGYPALSASCVYGNELGDFHADSYDFTHRLGIFSKDPKFVDWEHGDFMLMPHSPCLPEGNYLRSLLGALGMTDPTGVDDAPSHAPPLLLLQNHPNPFNPSTRIDFLLGEAQRASAAVYDASGRRVTTLAKERSFPAGHHHFTWNGRSESGQALASGIYFVQIKTPLDTQRRKMLLLK